MIDLLQDAGAIGLRVVRADGADRDGIGAVPPGIVRIGVDPAGRLPDHDANAFDIVLTTASEAPKPWTTVAAIEAEVAHLQDVIARQPLAATVLAQTLRMTLALDFGSAILLESFAYSTLLASGGFRAWHGAMPRRRERVDSGPRVRMARVGGALEIVLTRPRGRNAIDAAMRDALVESLEFARLDPEEAPVILRGEGAVFSVGGDLAQFGQADDPAIAHAIRTLRSPARAIHAVAGRTTARLHGPCVGAGVEIPAAAGRVTAQPGTSFRLPEVAMGVIPGAGGTATIPRRIGRHRACWMALCGHSIDLATALAWGLVDAVEG